MNIVEYYDGILEKDETKKYKLIKRVSTADTLFLYFKSIEKVIDEEKEDFKNKVNELDEVIEKLMLTIMDLIQ